LMILGNWGWPQSEDQGSCVSISRQEPAWRLIASPFQETMRPLHRRRTLRALLDIDFDDV